MTKRSACWLTIALVIALLGTSARPTSAQARATTADVTGTVVDDSGALLPGVTITGRSVDTNLERTALTDARGRYVIPALPPGPYRLTAELQGFATEIREGVVLTIGEVFTIDFKLAAAGVKEEITVSADAPILSPTKTEVGATIAQRQIDNLPINGRNFLEFSQLAPGVYSDRLPQQGAAGTSGLSMGAQRARSNTILVDGFDNNDESVGSARSTFSQEAIREFQVITNNFSAEFGKASGGLINIVTKSGTNDWHGNGFGFFRDKKFDEPNAFAVGQPPFSQQQYGGTFGGPLKHDRSFFFSSIERSNTDTANFVTIDPAAVALIRSKGFTLDTGNVAYNTNATQFLFKLDEHLSENHTLGARYNISDSTDENREQWGGQLARSRGGSLQLRDQAVAVTENAVMARSWLNELRFQFARRKHRLNPFDPIGPTVEILGVATFGRQRFLPQPRDEDRYQFIDNLSRYSGAHSIKMGANVNVLRIKADLPLNFGGVYRFAGLTLPGLGSFTPLQAFALGIPQVFIQGFGDGHNALNKEDVSLYVQDEYQVTSRLTLKAGLRYEKDFLGSQFPADNNNFGPRVALAWQPAASGRTKISGGYGLFYDRLVLGALNSGIIADGKRIRTVVLTPLTTPPSTFAWNVVPGRRVTAEAGLPPFPPTIIRTTPGLVNPYAHQANAALEHAVRNDLEIGASFTYVRGDKQIRPVNVNPIIVPGTLIRPDPRFSDIIEYQSNGQTWYTGLTISATKRFSHATQFMTSYTLSEAEDDSVDFISDFRPQDNFNLAAEKGRSLQDQRHRFVFSGIWDLSGYTTNPVLTGFQLGLIVTAASGRPFNVLAGFDRNGDGDGGQNDRPAGVGRDTGRGPDFAEVDLRVARFIRFGGRANAELIVEAFNLFNRVNVKNVNPVFYLGPSLAPNPDFGKATDAFPARQIQLGFKVNF